MSDAIAFLTDFDAVSRVNKSLSQSFQLVIHVSIESSHLIQKHRGNAESRNKISQFWFLPKDIAGEQSGERYTASQPIH